MKSDNSNLFRNFEHEGWQKVAQEYGPGFGGVTVQAIPSLLNAVGAMDGVRLLDVACGPGYVASSAAARGCKVVGTDFASSMIAVALEKNPGLEFLEDDAEKMRFPGGSFDAVAMNFGMLHLAEPDKAIAEAYRVLRPGGRYAFTVWDTPPHTLGFEIVLDAVKLWGNMNVPLPEGPPFFRFSDPAESTRSLAAVGFASIQAATIPQVWTLKSGEVLFSAMRRAAVRTAALLNMQTPDALKNIEREISRNTESFREQGEIQLPMPAILISATKPV